MKQLRICFFGPSGSGKSTALSLFQDILKEKLTNYQVVKLNVANPLHQIQNYSYNLFNTPNTGQDGKLLQFLASHFEGQLGPYFLEQLKNCSNQNTIILNSDCRNNAYQYLKQAGFIFVRIHTDPKTIMKRLKKRNDLSNHNPSSKVEQIDQIKEDYRIINEKDLNHLKKELRGLLRLFSNNS